MIISPISIVKNILVTHVLRCEKQDFLHIIFTEM